MLSTTHLVACSSCGQHARQSEIDCPHCGARLRRADGSIPVTAVAVLMGLSTGLAACTMLVATADYGTASTVTPYTGGAGGAAVDGGSDGAGGDAG
jgi:uncharacterized paraquat-inducible protein A